VSLPRLYREFAAWWPLFSAPEEYRDDADAYRRLLAASRTRPLRSVLEIGSGGGNNASHLKADYDMTLVDLSTDMLDVSRRLNPECEHLVGDMRSLALPRTFDGVVIFDAISYLLTEEDLRRAVATAYRHCRPGGVVLLAPDHVAERFAPGTSHGGHDGDGRALRYLAWRRDPDPTDTTYVVDYAYLLADGGGRPRTVSDRHLLGLFGRATWLLLLHEAGFDPEVHAIGHDAEPLEVEVFLAHRPA
jgi:SAM-dependent methyltransferase